MLDFQPQDMWHYLLEKKENVASFACLPILEIPPTPPKPGSFTQVQCSNSLEQPHQFVQIFYLFYMKKPTFSILHIYFYKTPTSIYLFYIFMIYSIKYSLFYNFLLFTLSLPLSLTDPQSITTNDHSTLTHHHHHPATITTTQPASSRKTNPFNPKPIQSETH